MCLFFYAEEQRKFDSILNLYKCHELNQYLNTMLESERNFYTNFLSFKRKRNHFPCIFLFLVKNHPKSCLPKNSVVSLVSAKSLESNLERAC